MRDSVFKVARLPHRGRKLGGGYIFTGSLLTSSRKLPRLAPTRFYLQPGSLNKIRKPSLDKHLVLTKLQYKNVSPSRRSIKPRRLLLRTTGRPKPRARMSLIEDMAFNPPKLKKEPISDFSYFGRSSFRVWIIYWYWGLSQKRAHESKLAYDFVRPKKLSFSKWPYLWIGSRQEHRYITQKAGRCFAIYHADTSSIVDVFSVICYTIKVNHFLNIKVWPTIWINAKLISKDEIANIILESLLNKLKRFVDWPPLEYFLLDAESALFARLIERYANNTTVDFYDNIIVCSYPATNLGMRSIKNTWECFLKILTPEDLVEKLEDRKVLAIPSTIPVKSITIPSTEVLWPKKNLFPNYFFGHNTPPETLQQLQKNTPWVVKEGNVVLIYNRFKKKGHRAAISQLAPSYYEDGLREAMRTDIRGMRYDIRMVESVAASEKKLLNMQLNWQPKINIISLGSWQALPKLFNKQYWIGFNKIKSDTSFIANHEVHEVLALFTQVYSTNNSRIGLGTWPWESLSIYQKGTWRIGFSSIEKCAYVFKFFSVYSYQWVSNYKKYKSPIKLNYLINSTTSFINLIYKFPNNKPWLLFCNISRNNVGIALTMLAYFTIEKHNISHKLRCWFMCNKRVPHIFFSNKAWTADGHFTKFNILQYNWQIISLGNLTKQFNLNSWITITNTKTFKFNNKSKLIYCLNNIRSTLRVQYDYSYLSRVNEDCASAQLCSIWLHLSAAPLNYPNMRPIKTILNNWTKLLPLNDYVLLSPMVGFLPVEPCTAPILRTWLQLRPFVSFKQQLGFRSMLVSGVGFPRYNIGKLRILYTQPGCVSNWSAGFAGWPKWLGYGRGWTGHLVGNWLPPEELNSYSSVSKNLRSLTMLSIQRDAIPFKDNGYWIYIFFRAPLGAWQALAVTALIISELRLFQETAKLVRVWHGGLQLPEEFCDKISWDNYGRYKWPERLLFIWHRTTIAWVERRVRGRRRYNRRYSKLPSETMARSIRIQCIRIRFPFTEESYSIYCWIRQQYIYPYGLTNRIFYLHKAEVELSLRWSQIFSKVPISGDDD